MTDKQFWSDYGEPKATDMTMVQHYPGCRYEGRFIPMKSLPCMCYERRWFEAGREAEHDSTYFGE